MHKQEIGRDVDSIDRKEVIGASPLLHIPPLICDSPSLSSQHPECEGVPK